MTSCWLREVSEALLEQLAVDDERISAPQTSSKPSSPKQRRSSRKSSAAAAEAVTVAAATSREPRPLTAMQELL